MIVLSVYLIIALMTEMGFFCGSENRLHRDSQVHLSR